MLRRSATPLRFAHSSGALSLDQAARAALGAEFARLGRPVTVVQAMPSVDGHAADAAGLWAAEAVALAGGRSIVAAAGAPSDRLKRIGVEHYSVPLDGKGPVAVSRNAGRLHRLIGELGVDVIHARRREIAWSARQATRGTETRLAVSVGEDAPFRRMERDGGALTEGDAILAGSRHVRDVIQAADAERGARTVIIPGGVDRAVFSPDSISPDRLTRLARGWGLLDEPAPTILAPGRIEPLRGQRTLARAIGLLAGDPVVREAVTIVAGESEGRNPYAAQLGALARRQGAGGRIFLAPGLDDLPAAMMLADIVVSLPQEPLGQDPTAAAAQMLGKPVLGADHGATAEVVRDSETGRLVPPDDAEAVAAAIRDLLTATPEARDALSVAARARAERTFSAEAAAAATVRVYVELLVSTGR